MENEDKDVLIRPAAEEAGRAPQSASMERADAPFGGQYGERTGKTEDTPKAFPHQTGEGDTEFEKDFSSLEKKKFSLSAIDRKKAVSIFGAIVAVVLLAAAASYFLGKDKDLDGPSGDSLILDPIMEAMRGVNSYSYDGAMSFMRMLEVEEKQYGMEYQVIYKGVVEKAEGGPFLYSSLVYDTVRSVNEAKSTTSVSMQSVAIDGKKYLKLDNLLIAGNSQASRAAVIENNLEGVTGNWYSVTDEDYRELYAIVRDYAFLPEKLDLLSVRGVDNFNKIFDYGFLSAPQDLGSELIEEIDTTHYRVNFDTNGVLQLITALSEGGMEGEDGGSVLASLREIQDDPAQSEKFQKIVDYVMQKVSVEIWVGKDDNLIYRFRMTGEFDDDFMNGFYAKLENIYGESYASDESRDEKEGMSFDIDYTLSGFDTAKVRDVEGAKNFAEVTEKLKIISPDTVVAIDKNAKDTDGDGLGDEDEKKYGSDPHKIDTDGDGYGDGSEVEGGYDPIVAGSARLDYDKLRKNK